MDISDSGEFIRRLITLGELFEANLTPGKQALYFEALRDLPFEQVARALNESVKRCKFMPKPAELRSLVVGDDEDTTERAWLTYKRLAREIGGYGSPTFTDAALADALVATFGSWEAACWTDFTPEMQASKRKEFGRVYRAIKERVTDQPKQLPGFFERENTLHGYQAPKQIEGFASMKEIGAGAVKDLA